MLGRWMSNHDGEWYMEQYAGATIARCVYCRRLVNYCGTACCHLHHLSLRQAWSERFCERL